MTLTGQDFGGTWDAPTPPTWYYRLGDGKKMWRTGYPSHPTSTIEVIRGYSQFREATDGLNRDQIIDAGWKAFCSDHDGELSLGWQYWGKGFYGLTKWEVRLLTKYLRSWRRADWWGLRSWLYSQGLHAAVYKRKPFTCQAAPTKGSGGYDHWLCTEKRGHDGFHRFNAYTWK